MPTEKLLQLLQEIAEERIPFNKLIGMKVEKLDLDSIGIRFEMRPELIGNYPWEFAWRSDLFSTRCNRRNGCLDRNYEKDGWAII